MYLLAEGAERDRETWLLNIHVDTVRIFLLALRCEVIHIPISQLSPEVAQVTRGSLKLPLPWGFSNKCYDLWWIRWIHQQTRSPNTTYYRLIPTKWWILFLISFIFPFDALLVKRLGKRNCLLKVILTMMTTHLKSRLGSSTEYWCMMMKFQETLQERVTITRTLLSCHYTLKLIRWYENIMLSFLFNLSGLLSASVFSLHHKLDGRNELYEIASRTKW